MSWRNLSRYLVTPVERPTVTVQHTVPPADVIPAALVLDDTAEAVELEQEARTRHMLRYVQRTLLEESLKDPVFRNTGLIDFCLGARSILQPAPADAEVLREAPDMGIRYAEGGVR